jgi:hypothetical protein
MRTLLDGIKGDLFEKARNMAKENMTWERMAGRLSKGKSGGPEEKELVDQESERERLIECLSKVAKDREGGSRTDIDTLWTQILDHIYVVLTLANP